MRVLIGGSGANPPTKGHVEAVQNVLLYGGGDVVYWVPSGSRKDKAYGVKSHHRVQMTELAFDERWFLRTNPLFIIDYSSVYGKNTSTIDWFARLGKEYPGAVVYWYTGVDSVVPRKEYGGKCEIEAKWKEGKTLMRECRFLIVPREGYPHPRTLRLPRQFEILDVKLPNTASSEVVRRIRAGEPFEEMVPSGVAQYIKNHRLYGYK